MCRKSIRSIDLVILARQLNQDILSKIYLKKQTKTYSAYIACIVKILELSTWQLRKANR